MVNLIMFLAEVDPNVISNPVGIEWVTANWDELVKIVLMVVGATSIVVKLTPTPKDDTFLAKIVAFISKFVALNPK